MTKSGVACNKMRRINGIMFGGDEQEEPDFLGGLGTTPRQTKKEAREEFYLPKPDAVRTDGTRTWSF